MGAGILFISADGTNQVIDTNKPLNPIPFKRLAVGFQPTDGIAFDSTTSVGLLSEEDGWYYSMGQPDRTWGINMATLNTMGAEATADVTHVDGLGYIDYHSLYAGFEGPGGQASVNCSCTRLRWWTKAGPTSS